MFKIFRVLCFSVCFIAINTFSMDCDDNEKEYIELPLSVSIKQRNVVLSDNLSKTYSLIFDQTQEPYIITHYLVDGNPIAKLFQSNDDIHFKSNHHNAYNFALQNPLQVGSLTIDTDGTFAFQQPVEAYSAYMACQSVDFFEKFLSKNSLSVEAHNCNNHYHMACSDIFFKGKNFNVMSGALLQANNSALLTAQQVVSNNGIMTCNQHTHLSAALFENMGILNAHEMLFDGDKIVNQGDLKISDSFKGRCKSFDHSGSFYVENDCILKDLETLYTTESSIWNVGGLWKAYVTNLYLNGCFSVKDMHIFSKNFNSLRFLHLNVGNGLFKVQNKFANEGTFVVDEKLDVDAEKIKLEKSSYITAEKSDLIARQTIRNRGDLAVTHLLAQGKYVENSGAIDVDTGHIKADRYLFNKMLGTINFKNSFTVDSLITLQYFSLMQGQNLTINTGIGFNACGIYSVKNSMLNGLFNYNLGLLIPRFDKASDLLSCAYLWKVTELLFTQYIPYLGTMYSLLKNMKGLYDQGGSFAQLALSLYRQKTIRMSDKIAFLCGAKNFFSAGKQTYRTGTQTYNLVSPYMNSQVAEVKPLNITAGLKDHVHNIATNWQDYAKQTALGLTSIFGSNINSDVLVDINQGVMAGVSGNQSNFLNINSGASLFVQNTIDTYDGCNVGCFGTCNLNINATCGYRTDGFIGGMNATIKTDWLSVYGNMNILNEVILKGHHTYVGAKVRAQKIQVQSENWMTIKEEACLNSFDTHLESPEVRQLGTVKTQNELVMDALQIDNDGITEASKIFVKRSKPFSRGWRPGLHNKGILKATEQFVADAYDIKLEKGSQFSAKRARLESDTNCQIDGEFQVESGVVIADGKITTIGKVGASEQLDMQATDITIEKTSHFTSKKSTMIAGQTIDNQGKCAISEESYLHGKWVDNSGEMQLGKAHIAADRYFWNHWGASVKVREHLTVDALLLLNTLGYVDADSLVTNAGIDINLGIYRANNLNMNSLLGWNAGILLPTLKPLEELWTKENAKKLAKSFAIKYIPFVGLVKNLYNIGDFLNRIDELWQKDEDQACQKDENTKYQNDILNFCKRGRKLKKTIKDLSKDKNTCASDVIPVLCQAKSMLTTAVQTGNQTCQMIQDNYPGSFDDLQQKYLPYKARTPLSFVFDDTVIPTISTAVSLFGPQLTRDSLCDINSGWMFGVNGSSQSLFNLNAGVSCFLNNYSINAISGVNTGLLAAKDVAVNMYKGYTHAGMCGGLNAMMSAESLNILGEVHALNNVLLKASKYAAIDRKISGRQVTIEADKIASKATIKSELVVLDGKEVILQDGSNIQTQDGANAVIIKAEKSLEACEGSSIEAKRVTVDAPEVDVVHAGSLKTDNLHIKAKNVSASESSHVEVKNGIFNVEEKIVNAGTFIVSNGAIINANNVTLTETSHVELNNTQIKVTETIHSGGVVRGNNVHAECKRIEASEKSDIALKDSTLNAQENIHNAGLVALQSCAVNTQKITLEGASHVVLDNTQVNVTETIYNEGTVIGNNVNVQCNNIEASETSNIALKNSTLNAQENIHNAGLVALQNCAVNTQKATLEGTSHVALDNTQVNVTGTIHNEGVVRGNNVGIQCNNVEATETSDIALKDSVLNAQENIHNAGTVALQNCEVTTQKVILEDTSRVALDNTSVKADEGINNKGYVNVSGNVFAQAQCINNSGTVEGDALGLQTDRLDLRETSNVNLNILSVDAKALHGEDGNSIAVNEYALVKTSYLDNHGSVQGPLILQFEGDRSDLKCIGQVEHVQYCGTVDDDLADLFADGHNALLDVKKGGAVVLCADQQDVYIKQEHEMAHALTVLAKNVKIAKELRSDELMFFIAKQNVNHNSLICKKIIGLVGNNVIATSHVKREYDGENYEDKHEKIILKGHQLYFQTKEDLMHKGVEVESEEGGTHAYVGRDLYCDASELEKYNKSTSGPIKLYWGLIKNTKTAEGVHKASEVCSYKSKGVNNINVVGKIHLHAPVFDAKGGNIINGTIEHCHTYDTHLHKEENKYRGIKRGTEYTESLRVEEKSMALLGGVIPVINSDQKISIAFICDVPKIIINAPDVECAVAKNTTTTVSSKEATYGWVWERSTKEASADIKYSPSYKGTIQTDAQNTHIQDINGRAPICVEMTNEHATLTRTQLEEVYQQQKTVLRNRPTKPLILATCLAFSMGASSLGATLGYKLVATLGCNSKIASSLLVNTFSAGLSSLSTQGAQAFLTCDGNFKQAMHQFASTDTAKNLLVSVGASGAMTGAGQVLNKMGLPLANTGDNFIQRCRSNVPHQLVGMGIKTGADALMGKDFRIALDDNARLALANIIGISASGCIGDAYSRGKLHPLTHIVLHTIVGAAEGGIINGADGAVAGLLGAGVAEAITHVCGPKPPTLDYIVALEEQIGRPLTQAEVTHEWNAQLFRYLKRANLTGEVSKFAGALAALPANKDMNIALNTASQAVNNNFLVFTSYIMVGASTAYSAYQIYNAYQEKGSEGLLNQLGIEIKHNVAGLAIGYAGHAVLFKVGSVLYPSASLAVNAALEKMPGVAHALGGFKNTIVGVCEKVAESAVGRHVGRISNAINNAEATLINMEQKAIQKVGQEINATAEYIQKKSKSFLQKNKTLTTPDGITIRVPNDSTGDLKQQFAQKVHNKSGSKAVKSEKAIGGSSTDLNKEIVKLPDYIRDNRVPLDRETILSTAEFQKTNIEIKGARVYKNNGKFYHRDTLHKGQGAHLEVYDKRGQHIGIADPITGELIPNTAINGRNL